MNDLDEEIEALIDKTREMDTLPRIPAAEGGLFEEHNGCQCATYYPMTHQVEKRAPNEAVVGTSTPKRVRDFLLPVTVPGERVQPRVVAVQPALWPEGAVEKLIDG